MSSVTSTSLVAQMVKYLSTMWETQVRSLGWEDPLEKEMAIQSSTIAWKIHGRRSLVGYSPWGPKKLDTTERLHFHFLSPILEPVTKYYFSLSYFVIVYLCRVWYTFFFFFFFPLTQGLWNPKQELNPSLRQ